MDSFTKEKPKLLGTTRAFRQYGRGGAWVSDLLPHIAGISDEVAFLRAFPPKISIMGLLSVL